jgi:hypothetical protein
LKPIYWSPHAAHIQSLFAQDGQTFGYAEAEIGRAESRLDVHLPNVLREFYLTWGACDKMTQRIEMLLAPDDLHFRADALMFCVENQGVGHWGIARESLTDDNPPVVWAFNDARHLAYEETHASVSDFLDALTYAHALAEGALHGGHSSNTCTEELRARIQEHWQSIEIRSLPWGVAEWPAGRVWPLYIADGVVLNCLGWLTVASNAADKLDEIAKILNVAWKLRW